MTEAEWLICTDPQPMLAFLRGKASDRKLRLFAVACCRRIWHLFTDERSRKGVEAAEEYADGHTDEQELRRAGREADEAAGTHIWEEQWGEETTTAAAIACRSHMTIDAVDIVANEAMCAAYEERLAAEESLLDQEAGKQNDLILHCHLVRDIFGNPFHPVAIDPSWLTPTVTQLAQAIYDQRAFDRMPSLADALGAAGCHDPDILNHCRQPGVHVRGCWLVDLLLGKQ